MDFESVFIVRLHFDVFEETILFCATGNFVCPRLTLDRKVKFYSYVVFQSILGVHVTTQLQLLNVHYYTVNRTCICYLYVQQKTTQNVMDDKDSVLLETHAGNLCLDVHVYIGMLLETKHVTIVAGLILESNMGKVVALWILTLSPFFSQKKKKVLCTSGYSLHLCINEMGCPI